MQQTQPKISEILHLAAEKYLWDGDESKRVPIELVFSCCAIEEVCWDLFCSSEDVSSIFEYLENMGLNTRSLMQFQEFPKGEERQGARYAWLKFAAMIAEEEGL